MFAFTYPPVSRHLSSLLHVLLFSGWWFLFLTAFDAAKYLGRSLAWNAMRPPTGGSTGGCAVEDEGRCLRPSVCALEFRRALGTNLVLILMMWINVYFLRQEPSILFAAMVPLVMFAFTGSLIYLQSLKRLARSGPSGETVFCQRSDTSYPPLPKPIPPRPEAPKPPRFSGDPRRG